MFMVYKSIDVQSSKATESLACSRLSDSGEDLKVTGKGKVLFFFFHARAFSRRTRLSRLLRLKRLQQRTSKVI